MLIRALAFDYDGTLAEEGAVAGPTVAALERLRRSGRKLVMVTGRELPDLRSVFGRLDLFDAVVAENGALYYRPGDPQAEPLAPPPPEAFVAALKRLGVAPLSIGCSIVATHRDQTAPLVEAIAEAGLDWGIIFNKHSLMCLPPGVDKASGLAQALERLGLSPIHVLGAGDAENDQTFLAACGVSVAVANALPELKRAVDFVAPAAAGAGVVWIADQLLEGPPDALVPRRRRREPPPGLDGELDDERSFRFCGPDGRLDLRARSLASFLRIAEKVDDETWLFHLERGDYSRWFADALGDDGLALEARRAAESTRGDPRASREALRLLIAAHTTDG